MERVEGVEGGVLAGEFWEGEVTRPEAVVLADPKTKREGERL